MTESINLRVLTSEGLEFEDRAVSVIAPGGLGYLGMLRNHAPLVTTLAPGKLIWQRPSGERLAMRIGAGLLEVVKNQITVLTDSVLEPKVVTAKRNL
jgi:F-type H+-transporting ATPase subunit epsilon